MAVVGESLVTKAGEGVLNGADPLVSFMFFTITVLIGGVGVLYWRNQKQNDDTMELVKETQEVIRSSVATLAVLSERIQNAVNTINSKG